MILHSHLPTFLAVVDCSTISAAAKRLALTQTGVTQRIKSLERDVGVSLFTRSRSGMKLTREGEAFLRYCLEARGLEGRLAAELKQTNSERDLELTLVGPASLIGGRAVSQCRHVFERWPRLNLRFVIDVNANRLGLLKRGSADLAMIFTHEVTAELDSKKLKSLEYVLVAPSAWKRRSLDEILADERLYAFHPGDTTGTDYLKSFGLGEKLKRQRLYANENQVLQSLLCAGVGFGVLTRERAAPLVESGELCLLNQGRALKVDFALAWYRREPMADYFREIVRSIK